jgi:hypothetical protein
MRRSWRMGQIIGIHVYDDSALAGFQRVVPADDDRRGPIPVSAGLEGR